MEVQNHKIHCPDVIQRNSLNDCSKVTGSDHMSPACNLCVFVRNCVNRVTTLVRQKMVTLENEASFFCIHISAEKELSSQKLSL